VNQAKYIGMDVHQATISVAVMDSAGKLILESILETKAATILQFIGGLCGSLQVTFEEGNVRRVDLTLDCNAVRSSFRGYLKQLQPALLRRNPAVYR
jgi:hypothetical protein